MSSPLAGVALLAALSAVASAAIRRHVSATLTQSAHLGLLCAFSIFGLNCLLLTYALGGASFGSLNLLMGVELAGGSLMLHAVRRKREPLTSMPATSGTVISSGLLYLAALAFSVALGVQFFTHELIPSSMTGDPPRHLDAAIRLATPTPAALNKPLYYALVGHLAELVKSDAIDKWFVALHIALLALLNAGFSLHLPAAHDRTRMILGLAAVGIITTGYSLFSLIYGYYSLILSASIATGALLALRVHWVRRCGFSYWLSTLLVCGVTLAHPFLLPPLLMAYSWTMAAAAGFRTAPTLERIAPGITLIAAVAIASHLNIIAPANQSSILEIVKARGFVDPSILTNIALPLAGFALLALRLRNEADYRPMVAFTLSVGLCLAFLVMLRQAGVVAPYYANRLQILLLPLLVIACTEGISRLGWRMPLTVAATLVTVIAGLFATYLLIDRQPLSRSADDFFVLRGMKDNIYIQNRELIAHSPLQFTAADRQRLLRIKHGIDPCVPAHVRHLPVMGSDHSVIWFGRYIGKTPSYSDRTDGYLLGDLYRADLAAWLSGKGEPYIAIITHMNYHLQPAESRRVRAAGVLVCAGDSYEIYARRQ